MDQGGSEIDGRNIIKRTADYVNTLFTSALPRTLVYHDEVHTRDVVRAARRIAKGMKVDEEDLEVVTLAAWLHDIGFTEVYEGHEEAGARLASEFLVGQGFPSDRTQLVVDCIIATRIPQSPSNTLAAIVCDADLAHLAGKKFFHRNELLRLEWQLARGESYTDLAWDQQTFDFVLRHPFHTSYAATEMSGRRVENLLLLADRIRRLEREEARANERVARRQSREQLVRAELQEKITARQRASELENREATARLDVQQRRLDLLAQDIQTRIQGRNARLELALEVLRARVAEADARLANARSQSREIGPSMRATLAIASDNHRSYHATADRKGIQLLGLGSLMAIAGLACAFVVSIHHPFTLVPSLVLVLAAFATIYCAVSVLRPRRTAGMREPDAEGGHRKSLLFYGNVHRMTLDEYRESMDRLLKGPDEMQDALVRDLYFAGKSLARKARVLRLGFFMFGWGTTVAALAYAAAFILR